MLTKVLTHFAAVSFKSLVIPLFSRVNTCDSATVPARFGVSQCAIMAHVRDLGILPRRLPLKPGEASIDE